MNNFQQIRISTQYAVGALTVNNLTSGVLGPTLTDDYRVTSIDGVWSMIGVDGEGPITVGVAHGDYTAQEIEDCLLASQTRPGDKIAMERSNRLVRVIGVFDQDQNPEKLNDGRKIKTRLNWRLDGDADGIIGLQVWSFSQFAGTLTGGALLKFQGVFNGFWT